MKKRILVVNEFSELSTGFSTYMKYLLPKLYATGKYEIAELATYVAPENPIIDTVPWKVYVNQPLQQDRQGQQAYNQNKINQFGLWKFDEVCLDFKPDVVIDIRDVWMCFTQGTPIITKDGYSLIENVKVGDYVFTGQNYEPVTQVGHRTVNNLIKFKVSHIGSEYTCTPEHPLLVVSGKDNRLPKTITNKNFKEIQHIQKGDYLLVPVDNFSEIEECQYTDEQLYAFGFWVAEGCFLKHKDVKDGIQICGHKKEQEKINKMLVTLSDLYPNSVIHKERIFEDGSNRALGRIGSKELANFLYDNFGEYAEGKYLPAWIFKLPKEKLAKFLQGLINGDGSNKENQRRSGRFYTISEKLSLQVWLLLMKCGVLSTRNQGKTKFQGKTFSRYLLNISPICHSNWTRLFNSGEYSNLPKCNRVIDNYLLVSVKEKTLVQKEQTVYNLTVNSKHTYCVPFVTHNCNWIIQSPYRKYFKFLHMPTCDGQPQKIEWLQFYKQCDRILTYSEWAKEVLKKESNIDAYSSAPPCPDLEVFQPISNKAAMKEQVGLAKDSLIIQTVMRNQPRKLYPELFSAFAEYLKLCREGGRGDLAERSILYCHTSFPDLGWDLPTELRRYGISHKVYFTYVCQACHSVYPITWQGDVAVCRHCQQHAAILPNTSHGVSKEILGKIMASADLYVQYSVCVAKNTEILTDNGWKYIQEIQPNELVWTHNSCWQPVITTMTNQLGNRKMHRITVDGDYEYLDCTEDHPIYGWSKLQERFAYNQQSIREQCGTILNRNKKLPKLDWFASSELQPKDMISYSINDTVLDVDKIDLADYTNEFAIISKELIDLPKGDSYPRYIQIDEDFCKFLGLFVADGYWSKNRSQIVITHHSNKIQNHELASLTLSKIGSKATRNYPYVNRLAEDVRLCSILHGNVFSSWCKKGKEKQLPQWVMTLPLHKQKAILQGLFMGDGHLNEKNTSIYVTISSTLAQQIKDLLRRQRMYFNVRIDYKLTSKDKKNRQPQFRFEVKGNIANGEFELAQRRINTRSLYHKNYHLMTIKSINTIEYNDLVYNIEVANDNSYTTKLVTTHNCEGFGMPIGDAKACGVPIMAMEYSATTEQANAPGGIPIKIGRLFQESLAGTNQWRALPDIQDTAQKLFEFFSLSEEERKVMGQNARKCIEQHYNWNDVAKVWESAIDTIGQAQPWDGPLDIIRPNLQIPNNLTNEQFVEWCYKYILKDPAGFYSELATKTIAALNLGYELGQNAEGHPTKNPVDRNIVLKFMMNAVQQKNNMEQIRFQRINGNGAKSQIGFIEV